MHARRHAQTHTHVHTPGSNSCTKWQVALCVWAFCCVKCNVVGKGCHTKASASASSTSEPVFRTLMALTEEERRLDWLIPKPDPAGVHKGRVTAGEKTKKKNKSHLRPKVRGVFPSFFLVLIPFINHCPIVSPTVSQYIYHEKKQQQNQKHVSRSDDLLGAIAGATEGERIINRKHKSGVDVFTEKGQNLKKKKKQSWQNGCQL